MELKYSKEKFEDYTHRFIVRFSVDDDWRNDTVIHIYSNSESFDDLRNFIEWKKKDKVKSYRMEYRATKEQDEMASKFINEIFLNPQS